MRQFEFTIRTPVGIHARPAAELSRTARDYDSRIRLSVDGREANVKNIMKLMLLNAEQGDRVTISIEGPDEDEAYQVLAECCEKNL